MMNWIDRIPSWGLAVFGLLFCLSFVLPWGIWEMTQLPQTDCITWEAFELWIIMFVDLFGGAVFLQLIGKEIWKRFKNRKYLNAHHSNGDER